MRPQMIHEKLPERMRGGRQVPLEAPGHPDGALQLDVAQRHPGHPLAAIERQARHERDPQAGRRQP